MCLIRKCCGLLLVTAEEDVYYTNKSNVKQYKTLCTKYIGTDLNVHCALLKWLALCYMKIVLLEF